MKNLIRTSTFLVMLAFLASCASNKYTVGAPASVNFGQFDGLEIREFKSNIAGEKAEKLASSLAPNVKEKIDAHNAKESSTPIFENVTLSKLDTQNALIAECVLTSFEEGSRAARYFIGYGAGKAYSTAECSFVSKESGETIAEAEFDGELLMGIFGGSSSQASSAMVNSIMDYIEVNY